MTTIVWIVVVQHYAGGEGNGLNISGAIASPAIQLAANIAARDPTARIVLSLSLPDTPEYQAQLEALPRSIERTEATQRGVQDTLAKLHGEGTLLLYWIGHGILRRESRQLLCADSGGVNDLRALDVGSLLARFRGKSFPRTQIGFFDACAQFVTDAGSVNVGPEGSESTEQFFYFSASATEVASTKGSVEGQASGFSSTVLGLLTDHARPFPPFPRPLFDELHERFRSMRLSTRAFPLMWTEGSGSDWSRIGSHEERDLEICAKAGRCSVGEFEHLDAAGCVARDRLSAALRDDAVASLLASLYTESTNPVRVGLLQDAWTRVSLARRMERVFLNLRLLWRDWEMLSRQVVALENLQTPAPADGIVGMVLGLLDQSRPERGRISCLRLALLAARRARRTRPEAADALESELETDRTFGSHWKEAKEGLPEPEGNVHLLIGLLCEEGKCQIEKSWLYVGVEQDLGWTGEFLEATFSEELNQLIERAKEQHPDRLLVVELLVPSDLLCSPRDLLEIHDRDGVIWLEEYSPITLRWRNRMLRHNNCQHGTWMQRHREFKRQLSERPQLEVAWFGEAQRAHVLGVPFPGPSLAEPSRNRNLFMKALRSGEPWMCWPRVPPADGTAFKQRVRDFFREHGASRGDPRSCHVRLAEALRASRGDPELATLWLFVDDADRIPYDTKFNEPNQRVTS